MTILSENMLKEHFPSVLISQSHMELSTISGSVQLICQAEVFVKKPTYNATVHVLHVVVCKGSVPEIPSFGRLWLDFLWLE